MRRRTRLKTVLCIVMSLCLGIGLLAFGEPEPAYGIDTIGRLLTEIEVTATVNKETQYGEESGGKKNYDESFYKEIEDKYNDSNAYGASDPLIIHNAGELAAFAKAVNDGKDFLDKYVKLADDIDLAGTQPEIEDVADGADGYKRIIKNPAGSRDGIGNVWTPIGNKTSSFQGNFDGNHKTIKGMVVLTKKTNEPAYAGLFGFIGVGGAIQNLGVEGGRVVSAVTVTVTDTVTARNSCAGGLAGFNSGNIENSDSTGTVQSTSNSISDKHPAYSYAGGLAGFNSGNIENSDSTGAVQSSSTDTARSCAGGLAGWNEKNIENSYSMGAVQSSSEDSSTAGGLIGWNSSSGSAAITNSYSTGAVQSFSEDSSTAGGLTGLCSAGSIEKSYSTGAVQSFSTSAASYAGGLVGRIAFDNSAVIKNSRIFLSRTR